MAGRTKFVCHVLVYVLVLVLVLVLVTEACAAVQVVRNDSDVAALWADDPDWLAFVDDLVSRLLGTAPPYVPPPPTSEVWFTAPCSLSDVGKIAHAAVNALLEGGFELFADNVGDLDLDGLFSYHLASLCFTVAHPESQSKHLVSLTRYHDEERTEGIFQASIEVPARQDGQPYASSVELTVLAAARAFAVSSGDMRAPKFEDITCTRATHGCWGGLSRSRQRRPRTHRPIVTRRYYDHFIRKTYSPQLRSGLGLGGQLLG